MRRKAFFRRQQVRLRFARLSLDQVDLTEHRGGPMTAEIIRSGRSAVVHHLPEHGFGIRRQFVLEVVPTGFLQGVEVLDGISPVVGFQIPYGAQNGGKLQIVPGDLPPQPVRFIRVPHPGAQGGKRKLGDMGVAM